MFAFLTIFLGTTYTFLLFQRKEEGREKKKKEKIKKKEKEKKKEKKKKVGTNVLLYGCG